MLPEPVTVLTIGGSDSGGAAGVQADLKTFSALGVYGMSAITAVTAQNSVRVVAAHALPAEFLAAQIKAVLSDYGAAAVKTGFSGRVDQIEVIAQEMRDYQDAAAFSLVVDPVLVNHRGEAMFAPSVTTAYQEHLLPLADLITPNRREAELLAGRPVRTLDEMVSAGQALLSLGARNVLVTGGREGEEIVDVLLSPESVGVGRGPYLDTVNTHGSGDTLSAAAAAFLAQGLPLEQAVARAQTYARRCIAAAAGWRLGAGHGPLAHPPESESL